MLSITADGVTTTHTLSSGGSGTSTFTASTGSTIEVFCLRRVAGLRKDPGL